MSPVNCEIQIPDIPSLKPQEITVGRHFLLNCHGELEANFDFKKIQLVTDETSGESSKYILKLIKVQSHEAGQFVLDMVSHRTGEAPKDFILKATDGQNEIQMNIPAFKVESVLTSEQAQQLKEGKEVPSYGFILSRLDWPVFFISAVGFLILSLILWSVFVIRKKQKIRKLFSRLGEYESAISPANQFYKTVRTLEKKHMTSQQLEKAFKLYLTRTYQVPFLELDTDSSLKLFKNKWPLSQIEGQKIKHRLNDLEEMSRHAGTTEESVMNYVPQLYKTMDYVEDHEEHREHQRKGFRS